MTGGDYTTLFKECLIKLKWLGVEHSVDTVLYITV